MGAVGQDLPKCPSFVVAKSEARGLAGVFSQPEMLIQSLLTPFLRLAATPSANEDEEAETLQGYPVNSG